MALFFVSHYSQEGHVYLRPLDESRYVYLMPMNKTQIPMDYYWQMEFCGERVLLRKSLYR